MNMLSEPTTASWISTLVGQFSHADPAVRIKARRACVKHPEHGVIQALVGELNDPKPHVRWEAAKALAEIADPVAAHGLMHALDDDDRDVGWVAGEGLIALGNVGLVTVLSGLTRRGHSIAYCRGAHHVLHELRNERSATIVGPVLAALETSEPQVTAPPAAYHALLLLKQHPERLP